MDDQAVIVTFLKLPDSHWLIDFGERVGESLKRELGEYDGHEQAVNLSDGDLFFYGPNADRLWAAIEPMIRTAPNLAGATVLLRYGPPKDGVVERRLSLMPN